MKFAKLRWMKLKCSLNQQQIISHNRISLNAKRSGNFFEWAISSYVNWQTNTITHLFWNHQMRAFEMSFWMRVAPTDRKTRFNSHQLKFMSHLLLEVSSISYALCKVGWVDCQSFFNQNYIAVNELYRFGIISSRKHWQ